MARSPKSPALPVLGLILLAGCGTGGADGVNVDRVTQVSSNVSGAHGAGRVDAQATGEGAPVRIEVTLPGGREAVAHRLAFASEREAAVHLRVAVAPAGGVERILVDETAGLGPGRTRTLTLPPARTALRVRAWAATTGAGRISISIRPR